MPPAGSTRPHRPNDLPGRDIDSPRQPSVPHHVLPLSELLAHPPEHPDTQLVNLGRLLQDLRDLRRRDQALHTVGAKLRRCAPIVGANRAEIQSDGFRRLRPRVWRRCTAVLAFAA